MKRVLGFAMFCIAIGMIIMMLLSNIFWGVVSVIVLFLIGYHFFCV